MSQNKQRLSWLEMLKVNQRAYLLFYKRYPRMILSRFALIIWKALTPYVGIYFSALIIEELVGAKNPGRIRFLVLLTLFLIAAGSLVTALLEKWKNVQSAGMWLKIKKILSEKLFETDYVNLNETKNMELYSAICQNHNRRWLGPLSHSGRLRSPVPDGDSDPWRRLPDPFPFHKPGTGKCREIYHFKQSVICDFNRFDYAGSHLHFACTCRKSWTLSDQPGRYP